MIVHVQEWPPRQAVKIWPRSVFLEERSDQPLFLGLAVIMSSFPSHKNNRKCREISRERIRGVLVGCDPDNSQPKAPLQMPWCLVIAVRRSVLKGFAVLLVPTQRPTILTRPTMASTESDQAAVRATGRVGHWLASRIPSMQRPSHEEVAIRYPEMWALPVFSLAVD